MFSIRNAQHNADTLSRLGFKCIHCVDSDHVDAWWQDHFVGRYRRVELDLSMSMWERIDSAMRFYGYNDEVIWC